MAMRKRGMLLTFRKNNWADVNGVGQLEANALTSTAHGNPSCSRWRLIAKKQ